MRGMSFQLHWQGNPWYLIGSIYFIAAWVAVYYFASRSRRLMLSASLILLPISFLLESLYIVDYWRPAHLLVGRLEWHNAVGGMSALQFSIEDLIFTFTVAGIFVGFFDSLLRREGHGRSRSGGMKWDLVRLLLGAGLVLGPIGWLAACGMNSVWAHIVVCVLVPGVFLVCCRPEWMKPALLCVPFGALLMAMFYVPFYQPLRPSIIQEWWLLQNLWGPKLPNLDRLYPGAPIEEVLWGAATAMCLGVLARFCTDEGDEGEWPRRRVVLEDRIQRRERLKVAKLRHKARRARRAARRNPPVLPPPPPPPPPAAPPQP